MTKRETYKLEDIKERLCFVNRVSKLFEGDVLMHSTDALTYVFDTVMEAVSFIFYRVKEIDYTGYFKEAVIFNIGSPDMGFQIFTEDEIYTVKPLNSYRYKKTSYDSKKEQEEIDFMLEGSGERFIDNVSNKASLIKKEFDSFKEKERSGTKIQHMLDRYFGPNGWSEYWFTHRQLSRIAVEVTLNVRLNDGVTVITVPSETPKKIK